MYICIHVSVYVYIYIYIYILISFLFQEAAMSMRRTGSLSFTLHYCHILGCQHCCNILGCTSRGACTSPSVFVGYIPTISSDYYPFA